MLNDVSPLLNWRNIAKTPAYLLSPLSLMTHPVIQG
jgi:hypothetical protein